MLNPNLILFEENCLRSHKIFLELFSSNGKKREILIFKTFYATFLKKYRKNLPNKASTRLFQKNDFNSKVGQAPLL
jgi:hypothetical protein